MCDKNEYLHRSSKLLIYTKNLFVFWFYMKSYFLIKMIYAIIICIKILFYMYHFVIVFVQFLAENGNNEQNENRKQKARRSISNNCTS